MPHRSMAITYLSDPSTHRHAVKARGPSWDAAAQSWYVAQ